MTLLCVRAVGGWPKDFSSPPGLHRRRELLENNSLRQKHAAAVCPGGTSLPGLLPLGDLGSPRSRHHSYFSHSFH